MHSLSRKKETEVAAMSGVANPSPAPALTAFKKNVHVKLKKIIAYVNTLILTALYIYTHTLTKF